jgi:hypothetical protein
MQASERGKREGAVAAPDLTLGARPGRRAMVRELQEELEKGLRERLRASEAGARAPR